MNKLLSSLLLIKVLGSNHKQHCSERKQATGSSDVFSVCLLQDDNHLVLPVCNTQHIGSFSPF